MDKKKDFSTSASEMGFEYNIDTEVKGFDGMDAEEYIATVTGHGLTRSDELSEKDAYSDFFRDPKVMATFTEHFDLTDRTTRRAIMSLNEADQASLLTSLTSKLYDHIVSKVDDIDYGDIPGTKGDITKLSNYEKLNDCIKLLKDILKEYKQDPTPIDVISIALANINGRKDLFSRAFKLNVELPIIMYNIMVLAIIDAVSYMISTCIEFIKTPNKDSFDIVLDKIAYNKTKNNMIYSNLKKFNKSCASGEFDKAMDHVIVNSIRGMKESSEDMIMMNEGIAATVALVTASIPILLILLGLISSLLKELVFLFYHIRMRVSEFFDIQADLLQMNAYNVEHDDAKSDEEKQHIVSKQLKIVEFFRKLSNKISFTNKKAEVDTEKESSKTDDKIKIDDESSPSALF